MKLRNIKTTDTGSTLVMGVIVTALLGGLLGVYLTLVTSQNTITMRSQAWNATIPVIEAGIEDALAHLAANGHTNLAVDGWVQVSGTYIMERRVGDGFYIVGISNGSQPIITSQGYVPLPRLASSSPNHLFAATVTAPAPVSASHLGRGVLVHARTDPLFGKGLVAKGQIDLNGNNILTDSYDSTDDSASTDGQYDVTKHKDNGDVATNSGLVNSLNVGNAKIMGRISTGPGGSIDVGPSGVVGSLAWHSGGNTGVETGYSTDDMNVAFPDAEAPDMTGAFTPTGDVLGGVTYKYVLYGGHYTLPSLSLTAFEKLLVVGDASLYVSGNVSVVGNAYIKIATNANFRMYVGGTTTTVGGNGIINEAASATNFVYYGLPSNTSVTLGGNSVFKGVVYAPSANLSLSGSGSGDTDFMGASISATATLNGNYKFHYDEALRNFGPIRGYMVTSWSEMKPAALVPLEALIGVNRH